MRIGEKFNQKTKQSLAMLLKINMPYVEACRILGLHLVKESKQEITEGVIKNA